MSRPPQGSRRLVQDVALIPFRFDPIGHRYYTLDDGLEIAHITGMLEAAGKIDSSWFTAESAQRGQAVHALTAEHDLGALDLDTCESPYRGYLLAYLAACRILQPEILAVEEAMVYAGPPRFGGRPDRVVRIDGR